MPSQHAFLSPSGSKLWLHSPACWYEEPERLNAQEKKFIESFDPKNTASEEGTLGHEFVERILRKEYDINVSEAKPLRKLRKSKYYSYGLESRAKWCATEAMKIIDSYDDEVTDLRFEMRVKCDSIHPELWGTSDVVVLTKDTLHIIDFKFGRLPIHAENNPQLKIYAYGALETFKAFDTVKYVNGTILQPRNYDIDTMHISAKRLQRWGLRVVKPKALETVNKTGMMNPSLKTCRYCEHRVVDAKHREMFLNAIRWKEGRTVKDLDMKEIEEIAENAATLKQWIDDVVKFAQAKAFSGYEFEKVKLVRGYQRRSFKDSKRVIRRMKRLGYEPKQYMQEPNVKPLTELEALLGKTKFNAELGYLIETHENRPRLVSTESKDKDYTAKTTKEIAEEFGL